MGPMSNQPESQWHVGHTEREAARGMLDEHLRQGRLDEREHRSRTERAAAATTRADLDALFTDLPPVPPRIPGPDPTAAPATDGWTPPGPLPPGPYQPGQYPASSPDTTAAPYPPGPGSSPAPGPDGSGQAPTSTGMSQADRLLAVSGSIATIVFLVLGIAFGAWAWAWIVFLIPGVVRQYYGADERRERRRGE